MTCPQRCEDREGPGWTGRGVHVGGRRGFHQFTVVMAGEIGQPREAVELRAETGVLAPVTGQAGRRYPQHDQSGVPVHELRLVNAHLMERRRLEVLDEDV